MGAVPAQVPVEAVCASPTSGVPETTGADCAQGAWRVVNQRAVPEALLPPFTAFAVTV
jgi:hypothetical protein